MGNSTHSSMQPSSPNQMEVNGQFYAVTACPPDKEPRVNYRFLSQYFGFPYQNIPLTLQVHISFYQILPTIYSFGN